MQDGVFSIDGISTPQRGLIKLEKSLDFEGPNGIYHLNVTATVCEISMKEPFS